MKKAFLVSLVAMLAVVAIVAWQWFEQNKQVVGAVRGSGIIEVTQVDVAFEVPGKIVERRADEGQLLDRGAPVARLDDREYRLQVERAAASRAAAEAQYDMALKGPRAQELDQALAALEAAESDLSLKRADHLRVSKLHQDGVLAAADLDRSVTALAGAESTRDQARARVNMLKEGSRSEDIEVARANLRVAEKALEIAELNLSRTQLFAPVAGRVLTKSREAGEIVGPGATVVTVGDLTRPWLNIYVGERDLGHVRLGMPADVTVDSFPDRPFPGRVAFVSDRSEFTPKNIQTPDERVKLVYRVKIELQNRNDQLKPGMPADAVLRVDGAG